MSRNRAEANYVEPFLEFLEVAIHEILHLRDLYPSNIFVKCKKYKIPVMRSDHPWVNEYIVKTLESISSYIKSPSAESVDSVNIVISDQGVLVEKFCIEFNFQELVRIIKPEDGFLLQLEVSFVSMLLRLSQATGDLGKLSQTATWWIELTATQKGALILTRSLKWSLANAVVTDPRSRNNTVVVPVLGVEDPIHFQLYIEKY